MNIYILFDCPDNQNDKVWLYDGLKQTWNKGGVYTVPVDCVLSRLSREGVKGKIKFYYIILKQCLQAYKRSSEKDIVICWSQLQGLVFNLITRIFGGKRNIVSMTWLTPNSSLGGFKRIFFHLQRLAMSNPKCQIIVNSPDSEKQWLDYLELDPVGNVRCIPDVYNNDTDFYDSEFADAKYCFTGGMNNRDWEFLIQIAEELKDIKFMCVALKEDFEKQVSQKPTNVEVYYNLKTEDYYSLMRNAHLILLPMKTDKVAGLINIIKSAQFGKPCLCSKTASASQYYDARSELLIEKDKELWCDRIVYLYDLEEKYLETTKQFQDYIKEKFSPDMAIKELSEILKVFEG